MNEIFLGLSFFDDLIKLHFSLNVSIFATSDVRKRGKSIFQVVFKVFS